MEPPTGLPTAPPSAEADQESRKGHPVILDDPEQDKPSRDFRITDADRIGQGSMNEKAHDNLVAILVLKTIEGAEQKPTDEERSIMSRYVGWGAMPNVFNHWQTDQLRSTAIAIKEVLTPTEYESARASTPNAHFTSPLVIQAVWDGLRRIGVDKNATVLEPAMGVGHYFGLMPDDMTGGRRTGVELDSITARIAKQLYPDTTIFEQGFEDTPLPDSYFDVVVGNVPFGNYAIHDPAMPRQMTRAVHDYFFAKSLAKTRPGGVLALITSRYTMDKETDTVRRYLGDGADLLGAIRLPNTAFKENAGTEVTTDILFLQKRRPGAEPSGHAWRDLQTVSLDEYNRIQINEYFAVRPNMMLGNMQLTGTMYGRREPTLEGDLTPEMLDLAIDQLPAGAYIPRDHQRPPPRRETNPDAVAGVKDGAYAERGGVLYIRNGVALEPAPVSAIAASRVSGQMGIRDAVKDVFSTQLHDASDSEIARARLELNRVYDNYTRRYGPLSSRENIRAFVGDPDQPLLLSLENYDAETKTATKTAVFRETHLATTQARRSGRDRHRSPGDLAEREWAHRLADHATAY